MPIQIGRSKQLSRKVKCWCPVHGDVDVNIDVDADVEADFDADVDADVPYPVESGWRPRASFDWSKAAQSTKLLWTTALDQLLWHLSWETGNTVQTNQGNALSCQEKVSGQWDDSLKHQAKKCRDQSQWNGHWWFMSSTVFTTIWRKFVELNPNILTSYWSKTGNCEKSEILDYQSICFCNLEGFTKDAVAASNMPQNIKFTRCSSKEIQSQTSNLQAAHKIESQIYVSTRNSREWFSRIWLFQIWQTRGRLNEEFENLTIS